MTEPAREQIDESSAHSDKSPIEAVRFTGANRADVLKFAGFTRSSIDSSGAPWVKVGDQLKPVDIGQWVFRDVDGGMHICTTEVLGFIQALVGIAAEAEDRAEGLESRIAKVREICADSADGFDRSELILAVFDGESEKADD